LVFSLLFSLIGTFVFVIVCHDIIRSLVELILEFQDFSLNFLLNMVITA
jgi:hypothetical protein